jgi:hypothetical protein
MNEKLIKTIAPIGLIIGGVLGMAGAFAPSAELRGLAWGIDGVGIVIASCLLGVYYFRKGYDVVAAGFLILAMGEAVMLSGNQSNLDLSVPSFGAGTSLWAASIVLISLQKVFPLVVNLLGLVAAALFAVVAVQIFMGHSINGLTTPLPSYAYPFFVLTLFGWA